MFTFIFGHQNITLSASELPLATNEKKIQTLNSDWWATLKIIVTFFKQKYKYKYFLN